MGLSQSVPRPVMRYNLHLVPGSSPMSPPHWTCPEHLPREAPSGRPYQMPETTSTDSFLSRGAAALIPSSSRMAELLTLSLRETPANPPEKTHLGPLVPAISYFHPSPVTIGEDRNEDRPVDGELCLEARLSFRQNGAVKRTQYHPPPAALILRPISRSIVRPHSQTRPRGTSLGLRTHFLHRVGNPPVFLQESWPQMLVPYQISILKRWSM